MQWRNNEQAYGALSVALHWLMLVLLVAVYACIELREFFPKDSAPRDALKGWHFTLGITVLALVTVRVLARLGAPTPAIRPPPRPWQRRAAQLMHLALYGLMIGMPLAGWAMFGAMDAELSWFGIPLPALLEPNEALGDRIKYWHGTVGEFGYYLIGAHALVALAHHYVLRDNTLRRMWFARTP